MKLSKLVLHHEAVKLKAMGFNIPVTAYYHEDPGPPVTGVIAKDFNNIKWEIVMISAPTIEVAQEWLRPTSTQCTYTTTGEEIREGHVLGYGDNYPCVVIYNRYEAKFESIEFGYLDEGYLYRAHDIRGYTVPWIILGHIHTMKVEGMPEKFDYNENIKHFYK